MELAIFCMHFLDLETLDKEQWVHNPVATLDELIMYSHKMLLTSSSKFLYDKDLEVKV